MLMRSIRNEQNNNQADVLETLDLEPEQCTAWCYHIIRDVFACIFLDVRSIIIPVALSVW